MFKITVFGSVNSDQLAVFTKSSTNASSPQDTLSCFPPTALQFTNYLRVFSFFSPKKRREKAPKKRPSLSLFSGWVPVPFSKPKAFVELKLPSIFPFMGTSSPFNGHPHRFPPVFPPSNQEKGGPYAHHRTKAGIEVMRLPEKKPGE